MVTVRLHYFIMTDIVKKSLQGFQEGGGIDVPIPPGTPNNNSSQDNGEGLGEDLNFIASTPNSSGRASLALKSLQCHLVSFSVWIQQKMKKQIQIILPELHWYARRQRKHWSDFVNNMNLNFVVHYVMKILEHSLSTLLVRPVENSQPHIPVLVAKRRIDGLTHNLVLQDGEIKKQTISTRCGSRTRQIVSRRKQKTGRNSDRMITKT